jgi:hypothetical protein
MQSKLVGKDSGLHYHSSMNRFAKNDLLTFLFAITFIVNIMRKLSSDPKEFLSTDNGMFLLTALSPIRQSIKIAKTGLFL